MPYFANFRIHEGHQFRLDTRIYLRQSDEPSNHDRCVAAVIGKNPGSANPTELNCLTPLSLDGDKLLPNVRNRFLNAYERSETEVPPGAFIRVWNLVYLCNQNLKDAIASFRTVRQPLFLQHRRHSPSTHLVCLGATKFATATIRFAISQPGVRATVLL